MWELAFYNVSADRLIQQAVALQSSRQLSFLLESMLADYIIKSRLYIGRSVKSTSV